MSGAGLRRVGRARRARRRERLGARRAAAGAPAHPARRRRAPAGCSAGWAGLSWADLGLAPPRRRVPALLVGLLGAVLRRGRVRASRWRFPRSAGAFLDTRYDVGPARAAVRIARVEIPLSTVVLEETAFRGRPLGPGRGRARAGRRHRRVVGAVRRSGTCCPPWTSRARARRSAEAGVSRRRRAMVVASTVLGTAIAGAAPGGAARADRQPAGARRRALGGQRDRRPRLRLGVRRATSTRREGHSPGMRQRPRPVSDAERVPRQGRES